MVLEKQPAWQAYEREVASLYRKLGASVVKENLNLGGVQIDVYVEERAADGRVVRTAVECKRHSRSLSNYVVLDFATRARFLRDSGLVDKALIVAYRGFSQAAHITAATGRIDLLTYDALVSEVSSKCSAECRHCLAQAVRIWSDTRSPDHPGEIEISQEHFLEAVVAWDDLGISHEEAAFLAHAAAYFGKRMRQVVDRARASRTAIATLVAEAAGGATIRVPWRAAMMLTRMEAALVKEACSEYVRNHPVRNKEIFPAPVVEGSVLRSLAQLLSDGIPDHGDETKLRYVLRQLGADFGKPSGRTPKGNAVTGKAPTSAKSPPLLPSHRQKTRTGPGPRKPPRRGPTSRAFYDGPAVK